MIKKISFLLVLIVLTACSKQSKEYAKISGLIANNSAKEISIFGKNFKKIIPINPDGTFSDTLKIKTNGIHTFYDGKNKKAIFINNGNNLNLYYDFNDINTTIKVDGIGATTSNYFMQKDHFINNEGLNNLKPFYKLDQEVFNTRISYLEEKVSNMLNVNGFDSVIKTRESKFYKTIFSKLKQRYKNEHLLTTKLGKGKPSPKFTNYQNYKGGKTSLDDFNGSYVYIDVWATWCGPCKQQIPFMKTLEKQYHNKNIKFVSISVDGARRNNGSWDQAKTKWKNMVKTKKMGGIQLFANRAFNSEFIKNYGIRSIPRFLLIDPKGNIVSSNAPRPSQQKLKDLLNTLNL